MIGLVRAGAWEVAIAAGLFSQFNMASATNDLIDADYRIGLPLTYRRGAFASRFQLYHQSSHLGDPVVSWRRNFFRSLKVRIFDANRN